MKKMLEFQIVTSSGDEPTCVDEKNELCPHCVELHCVAFDSTLHMNLKDKPLRCHLCRRMEQHSAKKYR